jgi:hypothetical protein
MSLNHTSELLFACGIRATRKRWGPNRSRSKRVLGKPFSGKIARVRHEEMIIQTSNKLAEDLRGQSLWSECGNDLVTCSNAIELNDNGSELWHDRKRSGRDTDWTLNHERLLSAKVAHADIEGPAEFGVGEGCVHVKKRSYRRI